MTRRAPGAELGQSGPTADRSDAFLSYAREDQGFARQLVDGLGARGKSTWVDFSSIPPSADWWAEICAAIESTDAFVPILTPDWTESSTCHAELDHALEMRKKIVPILHRDTDDQILPPAIRERNWIVLRADDDPVQPVGQLVEALETDLEWVRMHTRLTRRAREWEAATEDASLVLRGSELRLAEQWLAQHAPSKELSPSLLQTRYIVESRTAAVRTQRRRFGALAVALLVSIALGTVAVVQRVEASRQRDRAEREADVALSRQLGTQALLTLRSEPDLGMLLAVESSLVAPTSEARIALIDALKRSDGIRTFLQGDRGPALTSAFVGEADAIVVGTRAAVRWGAEPRTWSLPATEGEWSFAAISSDGETITLADTAGLLSFWHPASMADPPRIQTMPRTATISALTMDPSGAWAAVALSNGRISIIDAEEGSSIGTLAIPGSQRVSRLAVDAAGRFIAAAQTSGTVLAWDVNNGELVRTLQLKPSTTPALAFGPHGSTLAVSDGETTVALVGLDSKDEEPRRLQASGVIASLAFAQDGASVAAGQGDGDISLWRLDSDELLGSRLAGHRSTVTTLAFSSDGDALVSASGDGAAIEWDASGSDRLIAQSLSDRRLGQSFDVAYAGPDEIDVLTESGVVRSWEVLGTGPLQRPSLSGPALTDETGPASVAVFSRDHSKAVYVLRDARSVALLWDLANNRSVGVLGGEELWVTSATFTPDGRAVVLGYADGSVRRWDAKTLEQVRVVRGGGISGGGVDAASALAFDRSGRHLAIGFESGSVELRGEDGAAPQTLGGLRLDGTVLAISFSPDDRYLAVGGTDAAVRLLDLRTGEVRGPLSVGGWVWDLGFDPRGDILAAASAAEERPGFTGGAVYLWQTAPLLALGSPLRPPAAVPAFYSVAFAPGEASVAAADINGGVTLWSGLLWESDLALMRSRLCAIAGRQLTEEERRRFMPGQESRHGCL